MRNCMKLWAFHVSTGSRLGYNVHVLFAPLKQEGLTSTRDLGMVFVYVFVSFDFSGMMMESAMLCQMALCFSQ